MQRERYKVGGMSNGIKNNFIGAISIGTCNKFIFYFTNANQKRKRFPKKDKKVG